MAFAPGGHAAPSATYRFFCVGNSTARVARDIGFTKVYSANGDVKKLGALLKRKLKPKKGSILHMRGIHAAGNLAGDLREAGFTARESIGYGTVPVDALSEEAIAAIVSGSPVQVLVHSGRGAKAFLDLARRFGLHHWLGTVSVYGMSRNALKPLENAGFADLIPASSPTEEDLLETLRQPMDLASLSNAS